MLYGPSVFVITNHYNHDTRVTNCSWNVLCHSVRLSFGMESHDYLLPPLYDCCNLLNVVVCLCFNYHIIFFSVIKRKKMKR